LTDHVTYVPENYVTYVSEMYLSGTLSHLNHRREFIVFFPLLKGDVGYSIVFTQPRKSLYNKAISPKTFSTSKKIFLLKTSSIIGLSHKT